MILFYQRHRWKNASYGWLPNNPQTKPPPNLHEKEAALAESKPLLGFVHLLW